MALQLGAGAGLARGIVGLSLNDCLDDDSSDDDDKQVQRCSRTYKLIERGCSILFLVAAAAMLASRATTMTNPSKRKISQTTSGEQQVL